MKTVLSEQLYGFVGWLETCYRNGYYLVNMVNILQLLRLAWSRNTSMWMATLLCLQLTGRDYNSIIMIGEYILKFLIEISECGFLYFGMLSSWSWWSCYWYLLVCLLVLLSLFMSKEAHFTITQLPWCHLVLRIITFFHRTSISAVFCTSCTCFFMMEPIALTY